MKKFLLFCAVTLLICTLLVGCRSGKNEEVTVEYDLSQFSIVRTQSGSKAETKAALALLDILEDRGVSTEIKDDWYEEGTYDSASKEFLIGKTNRPESEAAYELLEEDSFVVQFTQNKIAIVATHDSLLSSAVVWLENEFFEDSSVISVPENYTYVGKGELLTIASGSETNYKIVRKQQDSGHVLNLATKIRECVKTQTGAMVGVEYDSYLGENDENAFEIILGNTARPETAEALKNMNPYEYTVTITGNKVVIASMSLFGLDKAVEDFIGLMKSYTDNEEINIPVTEEVRGKISGVNTALPTPSNATPIEAYRGLDDTFETVCEIKGETDYIAYLSSLEADGYKRFDENKIGNNLFATYTKDQEAVYVSYSASDNYLRIISETAKNLPNVTYTATSKNCSSSITQLRFDDDAKNFGMGYVITLEDGSYLIVDGGGSNGNDEDVLYNYLADNNKRTDGKIVIAAWIFTHEHWDHVANFLDFSSKYVSKVTVETFMWNFARDIDVETAGDYYSKMANHFARYKNAKVIKVHAGQRAWVRNAEIEILFTHELLSEHRLVDMNETSTIFRVNISGKKILFLADISSYKYKNTGVDVLYNMYGTELKSDIVQVAHHGWAGASIEIYSAVNASITLWPVEQSDWSDVQKYATSQQLLKMAEQQKTEIYFAKDGIYTLALE